MRSFIALLTVVLLATPAWALVGARFPYDEVDIYFDKPKGEVSYFEANLTLEFYNTDNESAAILSNLKAELQLEAAEKGMSASLERSYLRVEPQSSSYMLVTFRAPAGVAEGSYEAKLEITGNYTYITGGSEKQQLIEDFYLTINIHHPPATLAATWDLAEWGKLKAGQSFVRTLTVKEVYGYAGAGNVTLYLSKTGPVKLRYSSALGEIPAGGSKSVQVEIEVPERYLKPGNYWVKPRILREYNVDVAELEQANYTIPKPEMKLSGKKIDFGKLTFEAGKDTANGSITISEVGGYTPIEGISISLAKGEEGWIAYTTPTYVPPGGSAAVNFSLLLPPDATLGKKSWLFDLTTVHAGGAEITAEATVYFPGLEEAERAIAGLPRLPYPEGKDAVQNLRKLIASSKEVTELREVAMVMSVYSGARSFIEVFSGLGNTSLEERVDGIIIAKRSLNRAKIGSESLEYRSLKKFAIPAVEALEAIWSREAKSAAAALEERMSRGGLDYRRAIADYHRLETLYSLMGDEEKAEKYGAKREEMERMYYEALARAASLQRGAEEELELARKLSLNLKEASVVVNPFNYERVIYHAERALDMLQESKALLERAGEETQIVDSRIGEVQRWKRNIERVFRLYLGALLLFFLWFVGRVTLGLIRWVRDSEALAEGEVLLGGEAA